MSPRCAEPQQQRTSNQHGDEGRSGHARLLPNGASIPCTVTGDGSSIHCMVPLLRVPRASKAENVVRAYAEANRKIKGQRPTNASNAGRSSAATCNLRFLVNKSGVLPMGPMMRRTIPLLAVVCAATLGGAGAAAAADGLTVTASSAELGKHGTSVVLRGSYTCGPFASGQPDRGVIDLSIEQVRRGHTVAAIGYLEPSVCDGSSRPFNVTLTGTGPQRFRTGAATWAASGYVEGDTGMQTSTSPPLRSGSRNSDVCRRQTRYSRRPRAGTTALYGPGASIGTEAQIGSRRFRSNASLAGV